MKANLANKTKHSSTWRPYNKYFLFCLFILLSSCFSGSSASSGANITHSSIVYDAEGFPPMTPTTAVLEFNETYTYDYNCLADLLHKCVLETNMAIGASQTSVCRVQTSEVEASTCLPDTLKNTLMAKESPTVTALRIEQNKYRIVVTLTQGHREVFEVNSLEDLKLEKTEKEVGSL